jgi:hypothetical protein
MLLQFNRGLSPFSQTKFLMVSMDLMTLLIIMLVMLLNL